MNGEKISPAIAYVIRTGKKLLADGGTFVGVIHDGHGRSEGNVLFTTRLVSIDMAAIAPGWAPAGRPRFSSGGPA